MFGRARVGCKAFPVELPAVVILRRRIARPRNPGLDRGLAPGAVQDADRHAEFLIKLAGEGRGDGAVVLHAPVLPRTRGAFDRMQCGKYAGHLKLANDRLLLFAGRNRLGNALQKRCHIALAGYPLHVRLAGGHPDLADEDVLEDDALP